MRVERQISWWDKDTSLAEININHIPFEDLKTIFHPPPEDPFLRNPYEINQLQAQALTRWLAVPFNFNLYSYFVECWRID
jgi:hypothetical protein